MSARRGGRFAARSVARGAVRRLRRGTELGDVAADEARVRTLDEAVAENRRQDALLADLVRTMERQLVPVLERAVGGAR